MNKNLIKWITGVTATIGLLVWISNAAIRLNTIEEKAAAVPDMQKQVKIITLYIKLVDPARFKQAEELAK